MGGSSSIIITIGVLSLTHDDIDGDDDDDDETKYLKRYTFSSPVLTVYVKVRSYFHNYYFVAIDTEFTGLYTTDGSQPRYSC